ncbi:HmuY family protein [Mucilaginibacter sp. UR6-1]|uniref:HmuY family protein n=1 Tax=Mucilaginibacter sp. UR6-1 TaxID=1435643 RepID=UPI001E5D329A|nr:HmuY family protein [Mucilaginibacter sp. UR6-1]MCC8407524.1 HmuY family protein [Mucilaginibacter sp. UR6-1]
MMRSLLKSSGKWFFMLTMVSLLFTACSKDDDVVPDDETGTETPNPNGNVPYYKTQRVENFLAPVDDTQPTTPPPIVYFSLENKEEVAAEFKTTARWDISFASLYNSFIGSNNGKDEKNMGYGANGVGGILILKQPFEEVTSVPADAEFSTSDSYGTDALGAFGEGTGWYLYDFAGTIRGDGSEQKKHVAYAMPESRTLVVRTASGDYAKIKMISCYKDAFTPDLWFKDTPHMYFTFEYVLVPKGSTKFEIK